MRAFLRSPFVAALIGGAVVAVALLVFDVGRDQPVTTTVYKQAPVASLETGRTLADGLTAREIYERDAPGVVHVRAFVAREVETPFGLQQGQQTATGTGFVIDADGHLLTNYHVVAGAEDVKVEFSDETTADARVLGTDAGNDLALLKVDPSDARLRPLQLGDSSSAQVGDPVLAIGNPFGLDRTLTTGVVSALQRQITAPNGFQIQNVIQTDASINPGNSGGPLIDSSGRVIGINSQIATGGTGGGNVGIGFAVPINTAKRLLPELKRTGTVAHPYLGIRGASIDSTLDDLQLRVDRGVLVQSVEPDGPAARAGLRGGTVQTQLRGQQIMLGGDVIRALDGEQIDDMEDLTAAIARRKPGDTVVLEILRGGEERELTVRLGTAPKQAAADPQAP